MHSINRETYTAFLGAISRELPSMSEDIMQGWIDNPEALAKLLAQLTPPNGVSLSTAELQTKAQALVNDLLYKGVWEVSEHDRKILHLLLTTCERGSVRVPTSTMLMTIRDLGYTTKVPTPVVHQEAARRNLKVWNPIDAVNFLNSSAANQLFAGKNEGTIHLVTNGLMDNRPVVFGISVENRRNLVLSDNRRILDPTLNPDDRIAFPE